MLEELRNACQPGKMGGFLPGVKQIANVAALPGIVGRSVGLPDVHSGYGFAIGNMAAFDMADPEAIVSPGGVGFDINCGVRLIRTNLMEEDVLPVKVCIYQSNLHVLCETLLAVVYALSALGINSPVRVLLAGDILRETKGVKDAWLP